MVLSKQLDNSENHEYRIVVPADDIDIIVTAPDVKVLAQVLQYCYFIMNELFC